MIRSLLKRVFLTLALFFCSYPSCAAGVPFEEENLVNIESPAVVGRHKARFDFQHVWTTGEVLPNERMPIAELSLRLGLLARLQFRFTSLFNNSEVALGADRAVKKFSEFEYEAQYQILSEREDGPVSLAIAGDYGYWKFSTVFNNSGVYFDGRVTGGKLLASRDFKYFTPYLAYKAVRVKQIQAAQTYDIHAVGFGERIKILRLKKMRLDALGERNFIVRETKTSGAQPKDVWAAGLQFKFYNPHTMTLLVSNNSSQTMADAVFGQKEKVFGFRWSYRF